MSLKEKFKDNPKIYVLRILFTTITLLWMGLIFFFSSQNGESSGGLSSVFVDFFVNLFHRDFGSLDLSKQESILNIWGLLIRKGAHFTIFGILGTLIFFTLGSYGVRKYIYVYGVLGTFIYAISDELHQKFVSGRAGMFTDVMIDTAGSIVFLLIIFLIVTLVERHKNKLSTR